MTATSNPSPTYYTCIETPTGLLRLTSDGAALTGLYMDAAPDDALPSGWVADDAAQPFEQARAQLAAYFAGELTRFDLPLALHGTDFQRRVWQELLAIPYGSTISYIDLARRIERPDACRAVGLANGRNPVAIIVPCHRVIGSNGKLVGYGGGLPRKAALLDFEFSVLLSGPRAFAG